MEEDPGNRLPLNKMQLTQLLSQDMGHLHSLTLAARIHSFAYAPNLQALLDSILIGMYKDLKKILRVYAADSQEALDRKIRTLQPLPD